MPRYPPSSLRRALAGIQSPRAMPSAITAGSRKPSVPRAGGAGLLRMLKLTYLSESATDSSPAHPGHGPGGFPQAARKGKEMNRWKLPSIPGPSTAISAVGPSSIGLPPIATPAWPSSEMGPSNTPQAARIYEYRAVCRTESRKG